MRNRVRIRILVGVSLVLLTSCKGKYSIFSTYAKELKINSLVQKVEENYLKFNTVSVKFLIRYKNNNKKQVINGIYKIKRDSLIWITMGPAVGMEFFRAILKKDSVFFLNRFNKTYYIGNYNYITNLTKLDFLYINIENILSNQLSVSNTENLKWKEYLGKNFEYKILNNRYYLIKDKNLDTGLRNSFFYNSLDTIVILPDIYKIEQLCWRDEKNNRNLKVEFKNYRILNDNYFPGEIIIDIENIDRKQELIIKIKQISVDKKERFPFKIPTKKYSGIM